MRQRLDAYLVATKQAPTRSQAESMIRLGEVSVNGRAVQRPGHFVHPNDTVQVAARQRYVSRAGLKLASVAELLGVDFADKTVLDVGSSTGGFTDYALQHGARKVVAVDVGTEQLHPSLRSDARIELHEKTDIRDVVLGGSHSVAHTSPALVSARESRGEPRESHAAQPERVRASEVVQLSEVPDIVVMDVSFISLREILPHIATLVGKHTQIVAMLKPQFEAGRDQVQKGVIKNDSIRRQILKDFELWSKRYFVIQDKQDSDVAGAKGNQERFYLLKML